MEGYVATIGMFDGVHRGHQFVLHQVVQAARERGLHSLAITFDHSLRREQVLTSLDEKLALIKGTGINRVEVLSFTDALRQMTAYDFMRQVLLQQLGVKVLLTGYDNRFGRNREDGFEDYVRYGRDMGIEVLQLPAEGEVSSSLVRKLLAEGHVAEAAELLGRPYQLIGHVGHGEHIGTQLGYPTANIMPDESLQLIPKAGVYAVKVQLPSSVHPHKGMMNIGTRPTFGQHPQTLEVHVFDYEGDLYGEQLRLIFSSRLRGERRFESAEALVAQLKKDMILAKKQS